MPRGVLHYYRQMASRYGKHDEPDFKRLQKLLSPVPRSRRRRIAAAWTAAADCSTRWSTGSRTASRRSRSSHADRRRRYPHASPVPVSADRDLQRQGSTDDAANFSCGGNLEKLHTVCEDVLTEYKDEVSGDPDYAGMGVNPRACEATGRSR